MDKWGMITIGGSVSQEQQIEEFAKYGITLSFSGGDSNSPRIRFSDNPDKEYAFSMNLAYCTWLVNDANHIMHAIPEAPIPFNSNSVNILDIFNCGIYPLVNREEIIIQKTTNYGDGITGMLNIWENVTETDPGATDLILTPVVGKVRNNSDYYDNLYFKNLYFCYQRQFKAGDIIKTADGETYVAFGGWFIFKPEQ